MKNLLVGEDLTYERKIREMVVASRLERTLSKAEILELYLNSVYLGRGSWGIELAARSYFGKSAKDLTLEEGALLAGLTKGPNYFSPDRHPGRAQERLAYVLSRLREDGVITAEQPSRGLPALPTMVAYERPRRDIGFHFVDQVAREAKAVAGIEAITANSYAVHSTINLPLQRAVEETLQEGLWRYERNAGRLQFRAPEASLAKAVKKIEAEKKASDKKPAWQQALATARLPLYDVHWTSAVVVEKPSGKKGESWKVGLADGRVLPFAVDNAVAQRKLALYDVVFVRVTEGAGNKGKGGARAELRIRPVVQGSVVVLENKTGRILAMTGGFSYPLSQLNRVTQSMRQPGSAIKPLSYLAALGAGLQPNTLVEDDRDHAATHRPRVAIRIAGRRRITTEAPAARSHCGAPLRTRAISRPCIFSMAASKTSRKQASIGCASLRSKLRSIANACAIIPSCLVRNRCGQSISPPSTRPSRMKALRPMPYVVDSIERDGETVYRHEPAAARVGSVDRAAFYQLKTMMQGVLARGTARSIGHLAPYVAGKTGTSDDENDAWFVGFTNDVTVAVWIGYDNADGKRRTLGGGATGGGVAVPIFEPVIQAVWATCAPKVALRSPFRGGQAPARLQVRRSRIPAKSSAAAASPNASA